MNILFTDQFREAVDNSDRSIRFYAAYFASEMKDGAKEYISPELLTTEDLLANYSVSVHEINSIYSSSLNILDLLINPDLADDAGMTNTASTSYYALYITYCDLLTDDMTDAPSDIRIGIIFTNPKSGKSGYDHLDISRYRNLIRINIPIKCELILNQDSDTELLESAGVKYSNIFNIGSQYNGSYYVDKLSYDRIYYNKITSNLPYYGGSTLNKFGLKTY